MKDLANEMGMTRDFKGVWIPKEIWLNTELTLKEKLFFVEIKSLDNKDGCFASNEYFAKFFNISVSRSSQIINCLVKKGYLTSKLKYRPGSREVERRILKTK